MDNLKEELKTYVQNHINERIRLEELEKYFFYSKFHLCRKFKKKTSCTIMTYISNIKLEEAKRELQNGIEQNRCAMACQGCGAVFLFLNQKAVETKSYK